MVLEKAHNSDNSPYKDVFNLYNHGFTIGKLYVDTSEKPDVILEKIAIDNTSLTPMDYKKIYNDVMDFYDVSSLSFILGKDTKSDIEPFGTIKCKITKDELSTRGYSKLLKYNDDEELAYSALVRIRDDFSTDKAFFDVLKILDESENNFLVPVPREFTTIPYSENHIRLSPVTMQEKEECKILAKNYDALKRGTIFKIIGHRYDFNDKDKTFEIKDTKVWRVRGLKSLKEAEEWVVKTHPDYYMGCNIINENSNKEFFMKSIDTDIDMERPKNNGKVLDIDVACDHNSSQLSVDIDGDGIIDVKPVINHDNEVITNAYHCDPESQYRDDRQFR